MIGIKLWPCQHTVACLSPSSVLLFYWEVCLEANKEIDAGLYLKYRYNIESTLTTPEIPPGLSHSVWQSAQSLCGQGAISSEADLHRGRCPFVWTFQSHFPALFPVRCSLWIGLFFLSYLHGFSAAKVGRIALWIWPFVSRNGNAHIYLHIVLASWISSQKGSSGDSCAKDVRACDIVMGSHRIDCKTMCKQGSVSFSKTVHPTSNEEIHENCSETASRINLLLSVSLLSFSLSFFSIAPSQSCTCSGLFLPSVTAYSRS